MHYPNLPPIRLFKPLRLYMHYLQSVLWFRRISILSLPFNYLIIVALKYMYLLTIGIYGDSESLDNNRGLCYNYDTFFFFFKDPPIYFRERASMRSWGEEQRERKKKSHVVSMLNLEPKARLHSKTLWSWPVLKLSQVSNCPCHPDAAN